MQVFYKLKEIRIKDGQNSFSKPLHQYKHYVQECDNTVSYLKYGDTVFCIRIGFYYITTPTHYILIVNRNRQDSQSMKGKRKTHYEDRFI
jgi:hypothetical protein